MSSFGEISWFRISAESIAIVTSILLAFAIDAWWMDRLEQAEERVALEALQQEFTENIALLRAAQDLHISLAEKSDQINQLLAASEDGETIQVVDSLLVALISYRTPDVATGTLSTLLSSGRIGIIRNSELQQALAAWPSYVEEAAEEENLLRDFIVGELISGLTGHVDLTGVMAARTISSLSSGGGFDLSGHHYPVQVSATTRALVGERAFLARLIISGSQARFDAANQVLSLIDAELGR